jgi:hypothetical protein
MRSDQGIVGALEPAQLRHAREDLLEARVERDDALVECECRGALAAFLDQRGQVEERGHVVGLAPGRALQQGLGLRGLVQRAVQAGHAHQRFLGLIDAQLQRARVLGQRRARRVGLREHLGEQVAEQRHARVHGDQSLVGRAREPARAGAQRELRQLREIAGLGGPGAAQRLQRVERAVELAALHQRPGEQLQRFAVPGFPREQFAARCLGCRRLVQALEAPCRLEVPGACAHAQNSWVSLAYQ